MAIPQVTTKKISSFVRRDLEKVLATLPQQGSDVRFDPIAVEKALMPTPQEARTIIPVLTPPITKEVIIAPPMAVQTSSVLPLLVAGAILLMQ
jgi:hypothetical protein